MTDVIVIAISFIGHSRAETGGNAKSEIRRIQILRQFEQFRIKELQVNKGKELI